MQFRAKTPSDARKYGLTNIAFAAAGGYRVIGLSRSRDRFYAVRTGAGGARNILCRSTDANADAWTDIQVTALPDNTKAVWEIVELPNGEVLITTGSQDANGSTIDGPTNWIYKSAGWAANPATATWTQVLQFKGGRVGYHRNFHPECVGADGTVIIAEAGNQTGLDFTVTAVGAGYTNIAATPQSGTGAVFGVNLDPATGAIRRMGIINAGNADHVPANGTFQVNFAGDGAGAAATYTVANGKIVSANEIRARRLYVSTDFGSTWTQRYDLFTDPAYKYAPNLHFHGLHYDSAWSRIWATFGDTTSNSGYLVAGAGKTQVMYSDDAGLTWKFLDQETYCPGGFAQYTPIRVTPEALLLGGDALKSTGVVVISRTGYRQLGGQMFGPNIYAPSFVTDVFRSAGAGMPIFMGYNNMPDGYNPVLYVCDPTGFRWEELWRETDQVARPYTAGYSIQAPFGPSTTGRVVSMYLRPNQAHLLMRATLTGY